MASATAMYHTGRNPLKGLSRDAAKTDLMEKVDVVRSEKRRRLHKAFLRYHDAAGWPLLRDALQAMGRADLIGNGKKHLVPSYQPTTKPAARADAAAVAAAAPAAPRRGTLLTQHTGLPPRPGVTPRRKPR